MLTTLKCGLIKVDSCKQMDHKEVLLVLIAAVVEQATAPMA